MRHVSGQESQTFARFHCRPHQHQAFHRLALQRIHRRGHGKIGLAGAGRTDAEGDVVLLDGLQIFVLHRAATTRCGEADECGMAASRLLPQSADSVGNVSEVRPRTSALRVISSGTDSLCASGKSGFMTSIRPSCRRSSDDVVLRFEVEAFHHLARQAGLRSRDGEALAAARDVHFQRGLDLAQVLVERTAQVRQAGVVHRLERKIHRIVHGCITSSPRSVCNVPGNIRTST